MLAPAKWCSMRLPFPRIFNHSVTTLKGHTSSLPSLLAEMAMRWVCHLVDHHILLEQLLKFPFQIDTVLSV